jgi:cytoskeleton protein RodZ
MNQEPQAPLWPESDIKTIGKRAMPNEITANAETTPVRSASFGEKLRRERELRSITLDEIANTTKIGTRLLHALENEEFSKLPGGIFNKGFVRAYAKYLGLDEEQAVVDYLAAESEQERKRRAPVDPELSKQGQPQMFAIQGGSRPDNVYNIRASAEVVEQPQADQAGGFLAAAVILVFVLGIGGFGWKYFNSHSSSKTAAVKTEHENSKPMAPAVAEPQPVSNPNVAAAPTSSAPATNVPLGSTQVARTQPLATDTTATASTSAVTAKKPEPETSAAASAVPAEFTLDLRADEDSWAQIVADGKQLWSGVVSKDDAKSFRATKQLTVKLGNAPGVQLSYNGKPLPRFSQDSKTRTLTFTPEGLSPR